MLGRGKEKQCVTFVLYLYLQKLLTVQNSANFNDHSLFFQAPPSSGAACGIYIQPKTRLWALTCHVALEAVKQVLVKPLPPIQLQFLLVVQRDLEEFQREWRKSAYGIDHRNRNRRSGPRSFRRQYPWYVFRHSGWDHSIVQSLFLFIIENANVRFTQVNKIK